MKILLPVPPSVNALYANRKRGGRFKTKEYTRWLMDARWHLLVAGLGPQPRDDTNSVHGPYTVHIRVPTTMRGDIDNRIKPILDFLVSMGLTDDDRHCQHVTVGRDENLTAIAEIVVEAV